MTKLKHGKATSIWLVVYNLAATICCLDASHDCDETVYSKNVTSKTGEITSPNFPNSYGVDLRCIYHLVGEPNERVEIFFEEFEVKGVLPRCLDDYIDVYTQVREPFQNLLQVPLHGRYCGSDKERLPHRLISMTNILVIGFYTDPTQEQEEKGFRIKYNFIDDAVYNVGTPATSEVCGQTVTSVASGVILSPTYPGMYPNNIFCYYKINGTRGQRIKLKFTDIDLYSGGEHCPFDYIKVYDGPTNEADVIDIFCGSRSNISLYSTGESLHIEFVTKSGRAETTKPSYLTYDEKQAIEIQRRGFEAAFDISNSFVKLAFLQGQHIRGTECDQLILSAGETNGTITSPYYPSPYPLNVTCLYYIDGLQDKQNLEKVGLEIIDLDIPQVGSTCTNNGYLRAFIRGQEPELEKIDYEFCGNTSNLPTIVSRNPRLLLVFDSHGQRAGRGFKAKFNFITDYAIEGTPAPSGDIDCYFIYRSRSGKSGTFISPRYPSYYPHNTFCRYEFIGLKNEQVRITFENFKIENGKGNEGCNKDYVQVYSIAPFKHGRGGLEEKLIGRYCGDMLPGPQMSEENAHRMKVELITNGQFAKAGFRARYEFVEKDPAKRCVRNESTGVGGGVIHSPNYPHKYYTNRTCEWYVYSRYRQGTILLTITSFTMEGDPNKTGCGNTVLKIYTNSSGLPAAELCGDHHNLVGKTYQSQGNLLRLKFVSSSKAVGGNGFILSWTDLLPGGGKSAGKCNGFLCKVNRYCISKELKCNKMPNCGDGDKSDEENDDCDHARTKSGVLNIILGVVMTLILLIVIVVCFLHIRRKKRMKKKEKIEVHYIAKSAYDEDADAVHGSSGTVSKDAFSINGGQNLFREHTEKVSIV